MNEIILLRMKKAVAVIVVMFLMYVCCKFPDEVVFVCEWGFVLLKQVALSIYSGFTGMISSVEPIS